MAKIKPNDRCPCGSGKKYKKCCNAVTPIQPKSASVNSSSPELHGTWGLSGAEIYLTAMLRSESIPQHPMNSALPDGAEGRYKITFILCRPKHTPAKENYISFGDNIEGDSHLFLGISRNSEEQILATIELKHPEGDFTFIGYTNNNGFLSKIETEVEAFSFKDAVRKAHNGLAPTLSRISLLSDIPLYIYSTSAQELATNNYMVSCTLPYVEKHSPVFTDYEPDKTEFKFASLYREALNSNSPNYQYLCFYKIIEGIRKIREERTRQENQAAIARGEKPPSREKEIIPKEKNEQIAWLNSIFPPQNWSELAFAQIFPQSAVGRKLNDLIGENKPLNKVRNKIAHAILRDETEETFSIDDANDAGEVMDWLPLCKCITIYLLKKEYPKLFNIVEPSDYLPNADLAKLGLKRF